MEVLELYRAKLKEPENTQFLVVCDVDDDTMNNDQMKEWLNNRNIQVVWGESRTKIEAINRGTEVATGWDILLLVADDMIPKIDGFDAIIKEQMKNSFPDGDGTLHYHDGYNPAVCTAPVMGKKYYDRFGWIYNPAYKSEWCDLEYLIVAKMMNKYWGMGPVLIEHMHVHRIGGPRDNLYHKNMKPIEEDRKIV